MRDVTQHETIRAVTEASGKTDFRAGPSSRIHRDAEVQKSIRINPRVLPIVAIPCAGWRGSRLTNLPLVPTEIQSFEVALVQGCSFGRHQGLHLTALLWQRVYGHW